MSKNSIDDQKEYSHRERIELGLTAVFPTIEAYRSFIEDDKDGIKPLMRLAMDNGIIEEESGRAFEAFIRENSRKPDE